MKESAQDNKQDARIWLAAYFKFLAIFLFIGLCLLAPYSFWWLHASGDAAVERAVAAQARGDFAIFGSALSQDFVDYKLRLYAAVKPDIIAIGSSRVMQFRGAWFRDSFLNMGGVAGNLGVLRSTINEILRIHKPQAVIIGLDFWWFLPQWEKNPFQQIPPTSGSYNYGLESLKKPIAWLLEGKISPKEFLAPIFGLFGQGFRAGRYGIMAQQTNDGFGPDGSWYCTAEITGLKQPFDFQFRDTLTQVAHGIKAFYHARPGQHGPDQEHVDAFAEIWCALRSRGVKTFVFIAPLSARVLERMKPADYPHLFGLAEALEERGIQLADFSSPASLASTDCEFIDGFHGGEISYARILRRLADLFPGLLPYVNMEKLDVAIQTWKGHAMIPDERLTLLPETDFMRFGCPKKTLPENEADTPPKRKAARK